MSSGGSTGFDAGSSGDGDSSSSSSSGGGNGTIPIVGFTAVNQLCETMDTTVSALTLFILVVAIIFSSNLFGGKADLKWYLSVYTFPFFVIVASHAYIVSAWPTTHAIGLSDLYSQFIPLGVSILLSLAVANAKRAVAFFSLAAFVYLAASGYMNTTAYPIAMYVTISVVFILSCAVFSIERVKVFINESIATFIMSVAAVILLVSYLSPTNARALCGHGINRLVVCYPECGTITTTWAAPWYFIFTAVMILLLLKLIGWIGFGSYKKQKSTIQEQATAGREDGVYGTRVSDIPHLESTGSYSGSGATYGPGPSGKNRYTRM